jgi:hypothetical protein
MKKLFLIFNFPLSVFYFKDMKYFPKFFIFIALFAALCVSAAAQETGGIKGKVRNSKNEAISNVSVTARQNGKDVKTVSTDSGGAFLLDGLPAGDYNFTFNKNGYSTGIRYNVEIKKNKVRDLGDRLVLAVDQGTQVIIKGLVFDEKGRSVRGANIEIDRKQADGSYKKVGGTTSSYGVEPLSTGEFVFRFPEGAADFRITAKLKGVSQSKEVSVSTAAVYRLAITLKVE